MRILYVVSIFPKLSETFILEQITGLIDLGHEVNILASCKPDESFSHESVEKYDLLSKTTYLKKENSGVGFKLTPEIRKAIDGFDIIHAHFATFPAETAMEISRITGTPFIFTTHAYDIFISPDPVKLKRLADAASKVVTISEFNKEYMLGMLGEQYREKIEIIRCGIPLEEFAPHARASNEKVTILTVGRLVEKKGTRYAIEAFAKFAAQYDVELRVAGDGPEKENLSSLVEDLGLVEKTKFLGPLPQSRVIEELQNADIFMLTAVTASNNDKEGLPVVLLEAQAMKLPVISSIHTGIPEAVIDGETGFLTPEKDVDMIARQLERLILDTDLRRDMGENGRRHIEARFNISAEIKKLCLVMDDCVNRKDESASGFFMGRGTVMKVSVIICTYNRAELLRQSVCSLIEQDFPAKDYEIVVVDNNSTDSTRSVVEELASSARVKIKYVFEPEQGLSIARNAGIGAASGEIIIFTDDDVEAERQVVREYAEAFKEPGVYSAGGPLRAVWPSERPGWLTDELLSSIAVSEFKRARANGNEFKEENDCPWGANMAFRREVFEEFGGFPEDLGRKGNLLLSNEELLLSRRIKENGWRIIFVPEAVIHHKISRSRVNKHWFCHRAYWQGRSDAVLDVILKRNRYKQLERSARFIKSKKIPGASEFILKCRKKHAIGYLHQSVLSSPGDDYVTLKILASFASELAKTTAELPGNDAFKDRVSMLERQNAALLDSMSWKITAPLRAAYNILKKA